MNLSIAILDSVSKLKFSTSNSSSLLSVIKFSVIINNYNYAKYLREAIDSVSKQSYPASEIIVVDDGSTDDSIERVKQMRESVPGIKLVSQANSGQLSAIRAGIKASSGQWNCFLDADDTWEPSHLLAAADAIESEPDLGVYYSGHQETSGPPLFRSKWPKGSVGPCAGLVASRGTRIGTITSALCLKREFAQAAVDLDESFDADWRTRADDCLVFGASLAGAVIYYNPIQSVNYRIHGENTFAAKFQDPDLIYRYDLRKWRLILHYCKKFGIRRQQLFRLIWWEYTVFQRNRLSRYCRSRFLQGLKRENAPLSLKIKTALRLIRGKYRSTS